MTVSQTTELRGIIGVTMAAASVFAWRLAPRLQMSTERFTRLAVGAFALSRLGIFFLAFGLLHLVPHGDISLYMEEAVPAYAGKLVYRDFITPHAPLNPYLFSAMLHLHYSQLTIMFFGVLFDIAAMYVWMKAAPAFISRLTLQRAALLVVLNPTSLLTEAIDGQMNSFIALFLGLGVYLLVRKRNFLSGAAVAVPAAVIKFLTLIYAPGYLFAVPGGRRKLTATLGFVGVILAVYVPFALAGADLKVPLTAEGAHETSFNLIFLIEMITGRSLGLRLPDVALALSWFAVIGVTFVAMRKAAAAPGGPRLSRTCYLLTVSLIAELLCIEIFSKNCWDRYLVMTMFSLCVVAAELTFAEILGYAVWLAVIVFEPSYWAGILLVPASDAAHAALMARNPSYILLLVLELVIVGGSFFLLLTCVRRMLGAPASDTPAAYDSPELDRRDGTRFIPSAGRSV